MKLLEVAQKRDQRAQAQPPQHHLAGAEGDDDHRPQVVHHVDDGKEDRPKPYGVDVRLHAAPVLLREAVDLVLFVGERLDEPHRGDRLLQVVVDVGDALLHLAVGAADAKSEVAGRDDHEREGAKKEERELPVGPKQQDDDGKEREEVGDDLHDARGDELLQGAHVARHPGHELARAAVVEKAHRKRLQVLVEPAAQGEDHPLAHDRHQIAPVVREDAEARGRAQDSEDHPPQGVKRALRDDHVDGDPHELRDDEVEERVEKDAEPRERHDPLMGPRVLPKPPVDAADGLRGFRRLLEVVPHRPAHTDHAPFASVACPRMLTPEGWPRRAHPAARRPPRRRPRPRRLRCRAAH